MAFSGFNNNDNQAHTNLRASDNKKRSREEVGVKKNADQEPPAKKQRALDNSPQKHRYILIPDPNTSISSQQLVVNQQKAVSCLNEILSNCDRAANRISTQLATFKQQTQEPWTTITIAPAEPPSNPWFTAFFSGSNESSVPPTAHQAHKPTTQNKR